jgi:outer membrane biosynthesis protein TonB
MSDRKKIILAVLGALLLEATIILVSERASALWPTYAVSKPDDNQKLPELTMLDTPPPETKQDHNYMRTNDDQKSNDKPKDPAFESDKDTAAASEQTGTENAPLPTQNGKENHDTAFKNEDYSLDTKGQSFTRQSGPQASVAQQDQKSQAQPAATPTPTPTPQPQPTANEYAMLRPTPTPMPPAPKPNQQPQRQSAPPTAYRQQQQLSKMQGNINNRGRSSVAALGTPYGRFQKGMQDAIGSRWYRYVAEHSDLINIGTVSIRFYVFPDGHVKGARVTTNNSTESLASYSLQAIMDAEIPPMPPEMLSLVPDSGLPIDLSFSIN